MRTRRALSDPRYFSLMISRSFLFLAAFLGTVDIGHNYTDDRPTDRPQRREISPDPPSLSLHSAQLLARSLQAVLAAVATAAAVETEVKVTLRRLRTVLGLLVKLALRRRGDIYGALADFGH